MVEPGSPLLAFSEHAAELVERAAGSIVAVHGGGHRPLSGIHWRSGVIVTAEEALESDENIKLTLPAGRVADASLAGPHHRCRSAPFPAGRTSRSDHCRRFAPRKALQRAIDSEPFDRGDLGAVPPLPQPQMGTNVLIAWNCSTEQARVTAFAMPILKRASRVIVLTVERGAAVPGPTGQQLCRYLQLNEVPAKPLTVGLDGHVTGEAILAHANALGCDLLIKGAYTQSRLRQSSSAAPPATS